MIWSLPATMPQLGFVFHAAAVRGVLKTLAAASTCDRALELCLLARQIGGEQLGKLRRDRDR